WAAMSGLAIAIGPVIGGFLVEHVSWQSIFWVNVPIGAIGLTMTALVVRESRDPSKSRRLDPAGLITGTSGLFFLVYALIEGNARGWTDGLILGGFALSAVLLAVFFYIESHRESPMLPLSFFRIPTFAAANIEAAAVFFAMFGTVFFLTLYLQNVEGYSPVAAGIRLFAFSVVILVVAPLGAIVTSAFKRGFLARLTETGLSRAQATSIVSKAGASAAAGNAQLGTDGAALTQAVQNSFVHAIHIGILVSIGFLILASIVSA